MVVLEMKDIKKSFGIEDVLTSFNLNLQEGERIGLIGANGSGKTTVFNIIAGREESDSGEIFLQRGCAVGLLDQSHNFPPSRTILEECRTVFAREIDLQQQLRRLEEKIAARGEKASQDSDPQDSELASLLKKYNRLQEKFSHTAGYSYESKIRKVATGLGFSPAELSQKISLLSGGEKTRVGLIKLLLEEPDLLLLDEPTNHLDIEAVEWLESYLQNYQGAVIIISHDRYFLDRTISRLVEIKQGRNEDYSGNYSYYLEERERRFQQRLKEYQEQQKKINQIKEQIEQYRIWGRSGDNEKFFKKAKELEKRLEKTDKMPKPSRRDRVSFDLEAGSRIGHEVLQIEALDFSYQNNTLFYQASLNIYGGDKVALIGPNGSGKTTLLHLIRGQLEPDSGRIKLGPTVRTGYYSQEESRSFAKNRTVLSALKQSTGLPTGRARDLLAKFLFRGEEVFKNLADLSGGERSRLRLLQLVFGDSNFLLLDEPTNHLDLESREVLERSLQSYQGAVLLVSHDRYFLNQVADKTVELYNQNLIKYRGNYDHYLDKRENRRQNYQLQTRKIDSHSDDIGSSREKTSFDQESKSFPATDTGFSEADSNDSPAAGSLPEQASRKDSGEDSPGQDEIFYRRQKEKRRQKRQLNRKREELESKIIKLENRQEELEEEMVTASYEGDIEKLTELKKEQDELQEELDSYYQEWEKKI